MLSVFRDHPDGKIVYIAPLKALVSERISDWKVRLEQKLGKKVVELTGDVAPDVGAIQVSLNGCDLTLRWWLVEVSSVSYIPFSIDFNVYSHNIQLLNCYLAGDSMAKWLACLLRDPAAPV